MSPRLGLILLLVLVLAISAGIASGAPNDRAANSPEASGPVVSLAASVSPSQVQVGRNVAYTVKLTNTGASAAADLNLSVTLPSGFTYKSGSAQISREDIVISNANPSISGRVLTWGGNAVPPARSGSVFGINTFVQDRCESGYITWQLDRARELMGDGAWVKQLFYGITSSSGSASACWIEFVNAAYDRGLNVAVRLEGPSGSQYWSKPVADSPGNYTSIAAAFARIASGLPRRDGRLLYIQIWNEPNLDIEWGGSANPTEYAQFFNQTARAIRNAIGNDSRVKILNAPMSPGGGLVHTAFVNSMLQAVPESIEAFDVWASHVYPGNLPPELSIHNGQAVNDRVAIDSYIPELKILANWGRTEMPVFISETGYQLGQQWSHLYPAVNESNRAEYMSRAFQYYWRAWPEVIGVAPYELSDPGTSWYNWNWIEENNSHHAQYDSVRVLDKSVSTLASHLTLTFQAVAGSSAGTFTLNVSATSSNASISPLYNAAPVIVYAPSTDTPTPGPSPTPTLTPTPIFSPTSTPTPTYGPSPTPTNTATATPTASPTSTRTSTATPVAELVAVVAVGQQPHGIALDLLANQAYVAHHIGASAAVIDGSTNAVISTLGLGNVDGGNGAAVDSNRGWLYVANRNTNNVSRVALSGSGSPTEITTGSMPDGVAVDPQTGRVYVANFSDNRVTIIDGPSGQVVRQVNTGREPSFIAIDGDRGRFYVSLHGDDAIGVFDLANGDWIKNIAAGDGPYGVALDPILGRLYAADRESSTVSIIDILTDQLVTKMPLNCVPYQVVVNPASRHLFVSCADDRQLHIYDEVGPSWLAWAPTGNGAEEGLAVNPTTGRVYVSNTGDNSVSVIQDRWSGGGFETATPTRTASPTTYPPTPTATWTLAPTPSPSSTLSPTATASATSTTNPTPTPTPSLTPAPTATSTATSTRIPLEGPDAYEPDDNPNQASYIAIGEIPQPHTFHVPGDTDWARFQATDGESYDIETMPVGTTDTVLAVIAPGAPAPLASDDDGGEGKGSRLTWQAPASNTYYIRVTEKNGSGGDGYAYSLALRHTDRLAYFPMIIQSQIQGLTRTQLPAASSQMDGPINGLQVDSESGKIYVADASGIRLVDPEDRHVLANASIGPISGAIGLSHQRSASGLPSRIYVALAPTANGTARNDIVALDGSTLEITKSVEGTIQAGGLVVVGQRLFAADTLSGEVLVLGADDMSVIARTQVGLAPYAMAALESSDRVFTALTGGGNADIAVLDARSGTVLRQVKLEGLGFPQALAADDTRGLVYALYLLAPQYRQIALLNASGEIVAVLPATLDRPLTTAQAMSWDSSAGLLLVSDASRLWAYEPLSGSWSVTSLATAQYPIATYGLSVDSSRGLVYLAEGDAGGWSTYVAKQGTFQTP